jgi:hypothetical protein
MIIPRRGSHCPARVRRRVSNVTQRRITQTHCRSRLSCAFAVALGLLAVLHGHAAAEPHAVDARIVWARGDRAYLATTDSIALAPGDLLTVKKGKKSLASGTVLQVLARDLAAARFTSDALARISRLDRLSILAERPPLRAMPLLRIGYPGRGRANLLFDCARPAPRPPSGAAYRADSLAENAQRMVRTASAAWPDTIMVRLFAEASDEEIALERGELDLAVFWPGEASSRLRADPRWQGFIFGSRGVLAASAPAGAGLSPELAPLAALNDDVFRGDLAPLRSAAAASAAGGPRFVVDPSCPGRATLERFLERNSAAADPRAPAVRLFYLDSLAHGPDSLAVTPLFTVRCAIALEPALRAYVSALGADAIVDMLECAPAGRAP